MKRLLATLLSLALMLSLHIPAFADGGGETPDLSETQVGQIIRFGRFEQDNDLSNGPEPIEWLVLSRRNGRLLVLSLYGLDCRPFNEKWESVSWNLCSLRAWLNTEFFGAAFSAEEQGMIPTLKQSVPINPSYYDFNKNYSRYLLKSAWSKVFLLGIAEVEALCASKRSRCCELTPYAKARGGYAPADRALGWWWLRSPGCYGDFAAFVNPDGVVDTFGGTVTTGFAAVRPAMWIDCEGETEKPVALQDAQAGDLIVFGSYEQDNNVSNGQEPIEWRVLAKEEDRILALSRYALDRQPYNSASASVTWEDCTLRAWLNDTFLGAAFAEEERQRIETVTVPADENPDSGADPGSSTTDQVFLLSIPELARLCDTQTAMCVPTAYTEAKDCYVEANSGTCSWWLRSPGHGSDDAACVNASGAVDTFGHRVDWAYHGAIRPAIWITVRP